MDTARDPARDLRGQAAIVTGGATGIGRAVALQLAERGCHVAVGYSRSEDAARDTVAELQQRGVEAMAVCADVAIEADCRRLVDEVVRRWQRLDMLVGSAGTTQRVAAQDLDGLSEAAWDRIFAVNVKGAFLMARAAALHLRAAPAGSIVHVSSSAAFNGGGSSLAYAASKGALNTLTMGLARALAPKVRVNAVAPNLVETRWAESIYANELEAMRKHVARQTLLQGVTQPEHVAQAVIDLLTSMRWVTGQTIVVDGGYALRG